MTVDTGRTSKAIIPPLAISTTSGPTRQDHPSVIVVSDPQEEISTPKVLHVDDSQPTKMTVRLPAWCETSLIQLKKKLTFRCSRMAVD